MIAAHEWVNETYAASPLDHQENPSLVLNPRILAECVAFGFREEDIVAALNTKQTNQLTSTYGISLFPFAAWSL